MIRRMGLGAAIAMLINSNDLNDFWCLGLNANSAGLSINVAENIVCWCADSLKSKYDSSSACMTQMDNSLRQWNAYFGLHFYCWQQCSDE